MTDFTTAVSELMLREPGLRAMKAEMDRQCENALATLSRTEETARRIADRIREQGSLVMYGMGGSHHVNRIAEGLYIDAGLDCRSVTASEAILRPSALDKKRVCLITSQSGESGEVVELLAAMPKDIYRAALTLDPDSTLAASSHDVLVAEGGPEAAFAATRSIILTLAMHAAILQQLGIDQTKLQKVLTDNQPSELGNAAKALSRVKAIVVAGRGLMDGVAGSASLSLMELARIPTIGFETGQFRHGPLEMLGPDIGVILMRSAGADRDSIPPLVKTCVDAGCPTVVLDSSGHACDATYRVEMPALEGLAAAAQILLTLQILNVQIAADNLTTGVGMPLRTTKITL
ncbi:SIS domain-containing protein [Rhizobium metallidurans]|uniref:Glutamine--fructose-6-phosphate aminotransferase [isomerizing] n=1 Tax=Rhizobium metallidurans TaxID=1265931 RepID=A0A7W6CTC5_9HYPH|nr:SIS domain-containing protein [Rhizobium metallidurans]MBB3966076.1 fructoselysine-6-P-deglycase FrlB-like protein [Rhizobium metallidurans]